MKKISVSLAGAALAGAAVFYFSKAIVNSSFPRPLATSTLRLPNEIAYRPIIRT